MRISALKIENFRGIREGNISFTKHSVLVGSNNAGKTTVIEALTLLLGRDRLIRDLSEHDFYGSNPEPSTRIKLVATITEFDEDDPDLNTDWFRDGRAVPKWFDHETGLIHSIRKKPEWALSCQIAVQARFDNESLFVEMVRYFHDSEDAVDPFVDDAVTPVPGKLIHQLGFYLVRASRTWDRAFSWGSELFKRTVTAAGAQPSAALLAERDRLRSPALPIEKDPQISALINHVNGEIAQCLPDAPEVQLRLTTTDSRAVMEAVSAHFATENGPSIPAGRQGSGLVSLQGLMLLIELGRLRSTAGDGFIMALEEPELHLPPSTQQQLVQRIQSLSSQTFITSHSPQISAIAQPTSIIVLRNQDGILSSKLVLKKPLNPSSPNWKRKLFQTNRAELLAALMQRAVLVPEGLSDFLLLRILLKSLILTDGWLATMKVQFGLNVGVIPTHDASVESTFSAVSRIHPRVCCMVDGDKAGIAYTKSLLDGSSPPAAIIRWQSGAMIEDIVGWVLEGDSEEVLPLLTQIFESQPSSVSIVVEALKAKKTDLVKYEAVAEAIAQIPACRLRATELFESLAKVCIGESEDQKRFAENQSNVWVFEP